MKKYLIALALMLCLCVSCEEDSWSGSPYLQVWPTITVVLKEGSPRTYEDADFSVGAHVIWVAPKNGPKAVFNKVDVDHVTAEWRPEDGV